MGPKEVKDSIGAVIEVEPLSPDDNPSHRSYLQNMNDEEVDQSLHYKLKLEGKTPSIMGAITLGEGHTVKDVHSSDVRNKSGGKHTIVIAGIFQELVQGGLLN